MLGHASAAFTLDVYSQLLPHMQDSAAASGNARENSRRSSAFNSAARIAGFYDGARYATGDAAATLRLK